MRLTDAIFDLISDQPFIFCPTFILFLTPEPYFTLEIFPFFRLGGRDHTANTDFGIQDMVSEISMLKQEIFNS